MYCGNVIVLRMLMVGKGRCSEEGNSEYEARVTATELSASEQPADHHGTPGQTSLQHNTIPRAVHLFSKHSNYSLDRKQQAAEF